ncbi:regulator of G-protein signaling 20-like [Elysia marginata]|uniref:Regulator of G-protein signaling 20-like n=1 Tax=Elysia marginata TaxID=1093978 RepID=A0AAV4HBX8_9GAST|nr:regulator of G-protein signaling 20-like [Elysia marginata]
MAGHQYSPFPLSFLPSIMHSLAVKSSNGGGDKSRDNKLGAVTEKEEPPTLEELRMWGESFDKLMKCAGGRKIFREFLRSEYSEENMLFYLACEDLKKERIPELIEEKARLIYEDYISILSPKEVSVFLHGKTTFLLRLFFISNLSV